MEKWSPREKLFILLVTVVSFLCTFGFFKLSFFLWTKSKLIGKNIGVKFTIQMISLEILKIMASIVSFLVGLGCAFIIFLVIRYIVFDTEPKPKK